MTNQAIGEAIYPTLKEFFDAFLIVGIMPDGSAVSITCHNDRATTEEDLKTLIAAEAMDAVAHDQAQ